MRYRLLAAIAIVALAGCRAGDSVKPDESLNGSPSFDIKDGTHSNGNADFFFLPPMAANPVGSAKYDATQFDASLTPTVEICRIGGSCSSVNVTASDGMYRYNWTAPADAGIATYRVEVLLGLVSLGYADVKTAPKQNDLKDVDAASFVTVLNGQSLPIKFRIEANALCIAQGGACSAKIISLANGGNVTTVIGGLPAGVIVQPGSGNTTHKVTLAVCTNLNPRVTDLPTFGPCMSVTADPELPEQGLLIPSTVFICALTPALNALSNTEQRDLVTMHKYHETPASIKSLRRVTACESSFASNGSLKEMFVALRRGAFEQAGREVAALLAPKTLNAAARRLDVGAGGEALDWSDFQGALPAKLTIVAGNNQTGVAGSTLPIAPQVQVTDLFGEPVVGARVRFGTTPADCAAASGGLSGGTGHASTSWTLSATPGSQSMYACGRGLAGTDFNGPRGGQSVVDPFQPLSSSHHVDGASVANGPAIEVMVGSVEFNATGTTLPNTPIAFGSGGYNSYGPFSIFEPITDPTGWPLPSTANVSTGMGSQSPFRGSSTICAITTPAVTLESFPLNTDIYVTKTFNVPAAQAGGTLVATIWVDNDLRVWYDGSDVTSTVPPAGGNSYNIWTGWWNHGGCADIDPAVLSIPNVAAGPHTISIRAHDYGGVGFLDMQLVVIPPP